MASTENPDPETGKAEQTPEIPSDLAPTPATAAGFLDCRQIDVITRVLLFAATLTSLIVMVTSEQTELTQSSGAKSPVPVSAEFNDSPAFIYFVVALVIASFYSLVSTLISISVLSRPEFSAQFSIFLSSFDVVILGILASATGTAGGVAYVGLRGNDHLGWNKICNVYDKFCRHIASSLALSLFASLLLLLLSLCSSLHKKNPN
ncbi:PREDICTED: CASP-like protein 1D2 [Tarenaya hassleriana]|uniref:CASP-like protein 1D2 n=1 Tax=Tarenaya hassleriana TaxID=28532 RepID=UPI00053C7D89|nr:PREDICTED: CASP-like protein 1D2 [Tarenaya hassleriana]